MEFLVGTGIVNAEDSDLNQSPEKKQLVAKWKAQEKIYGVNDDPEMLRYGLHRAKTMRN